MLFAFATSKLFRPSC